MRRAPILVAAALVAGSVAVSIPGGVATTAASPSSAPSIAPASGTIMFARSDKDGDPATLYTVAPDGSGMQTAEAAFDCCNQWSFDGKRILLPATAPDGKLGTTAMIDPDGSNRALVPLPDATLNLGAGAWTPGGRIVFDGWDDQDDSRNGAYIADPTDISSLERLTSTTGGGHDFPVSVSPDGSHVLLTRVAPDPANPGDTLQSGDLMVVGTDGTDLKQLNAHGFRVNSDTSWGNEATWSPDGKRVAFVAYAGDFGSPASVYVTDIGAGEPNAIVTGISSWETPQWSPDGTWIAFDGGSADANGVVVIHPDGTGRTSLVPTHAADGSSVDPAKTCCAVWSPDGTKLLFQVSQGGQTVDLYTMNTDGSDLRRLTNHPGYYAWYGWGPSPAR